MPKIFVSPFKGGTTSVGKALDMAGFKTDVSLVGRHKIISDFDRRMINDVNSFLDNFFGFAQIPKQLSTQIEALLGGMIRKVSGDTDVFQDVPLGHELIHPYIKKIIFPDCKFIFLERDRNSYVKSVKNQLLKCASGLRGNLLAKKYHHCNELFGTAPDLADAISWNNYKRWRLRYLDISRLFPDDVLFMRVTEGWDPLCEFLGFEMPNEPFPWENKS